MRVSIILAIIFILFNLILIKSQKVPSIPWPPQVTYNGTQSNWTRIAPTNYIKPREYQTVVYDMNNNRLIIFGGRAADGTFLNDVWSWSFVANRFIQINPGGEQIPERSDHIAGVDVANQRMFVFGGKNKKGTLGDFWFLSLVSGSEKWIKVCSKKNSTAPCNNLPGERWGGFGGSFVGPNYGKYFFVSHGKSGFSNVRGDTWAFNVNTFTWKDITGEDGNQGRFVIGMNQKSPFPRIGAHATMVGPLSLSIYGGCGAGGFGGCPSQDGWLMNYNEGSGKAEWLKFPTCPIRSYNGQAVPIPGTNQTAIGRYSQPMFFGGYGGTIGGRYHSDNIFEIYDTASSLSGSARWSRTTLLSLRDNPLQTPGGRTGGSMVLVHPVDVQTENTDFVVFFGGRDRHSTVRSDVWYLTGQSLLGRRFKCSSNYNYRMIHGIMMFIAFGIIFPFTMLLARFGKDSFLPRLREKSPWLWVHAVANIFGCLITIPALVLAIVAVNTGHWTSIPHAYLGIIAFAFVMFNPIWGAFYPDKESGSRAGWAYVHLWIGRLAILLAFVNMMLGILMIRASVIIFALYIVYLVLYFVIFIVFFLLYMKKSGDTCAKALNPSYRSGKYDY